MYLISVICFTIEVHIKMHRCIHLVFSTVGNSDCRNVDRNIHQWYYLVSLFADSLQSTVFRFWNGAPRQHCNGLAELFLSVLRRCDDSGLLLVPHSAYRTFMESCATADNTGGGRRSRREVRYSILRSLRNDQWRWGRQFVSSRNYTSENRNRVNRGWPFGSSIQLFFF